MPAIPTYALPQVQLNSGPQPRVQATQIPNTVGSQAIEAGTALMRGGSDLNKVMLDATNEANQVRVNDAMNKAIAIRLRLTHDKDEGFTGLKGQAALERPDKKPLTVEYGERFDKEMAAIRDTLGNDAQKQAFQMQTGQMGAQFRGALQQHEMGEFKSFRESTHAGTVQVGQKQMALDWANPDAVAQAANAIKASMAELGRLKGMAPAEVLAKTIEQLSPAHNAVIAGALQERKLDYAKQYFDKVQAELTPDTRLRLKDALQQTDSAIQASNAADEVWSKLGPGKNMNAPVDSFAMESAVREKFKDDPVKAKEAIGELKARAQAFNATQVEYAASNVNKVFDKLLNGTPLSVIRTSPEWLATPAVKQDQILHQMEQREATRASRAASEATRGAANEARELTRMKRNNEMLYMTNAGEYMRMTNPDVLAGMSREQVASQRAVVGIDAANHLLTKWDGLSKGQNKVIEARMDKQDFDHIADQMGLKPFAAKSEEDKRKLGELHYRVEQLIDMAQKNKKGVLTREEKIEVVRQEMGRTVAVGSWFGLKQTETPVISLGKKELSSVTIPGADRTQIVDALKQMAKTHPNSPSYAPTEENVRRLYLANKSPAAGLINGK
jgi:hypothetical protein